MQVIPLLLSSSSGERARKKLQKICKNETSTHSHPRFLAQPLLHILAQLQGQQLFGNVVEKSSA